MCLHEVHNFFGCIFDRDGLKGDSIFTDFFIAYTAKPKEFWQNNIRDLHLLTQYFRDAYYQSGEENKKLGLARDKQSDMAHATLRRKDTHWYALYETSC